MGRNDRNGSSAKGRVKFRVIEFELDGSDSTLQESLRSIVTAIGGRVQGAVRLIERAGSSTPDSGTGQSDVEPGGDTAVAETESDGSPDDGGGRSSRQPRTYKSLSIINDLDLTNGESLQSFCESKKPTDDWRRYLAICAWLKEKRGVDEVGIDHIYTCYRAMGWHPRKDVAQPLREMKSKQGWFAKGKAKGTYAINHIGIAEVAKS